MFWIAGIDEAGRGPLAGPVTAACVCLPPGYTNPDIADSKKLKEEARDSLEVEIRKIAVMSAVVSVGHHRIDQKNIRQATRLAMRIASDRVYEGLSKKYGAGKIVFLIDGNTPIETSHTQETIVKGDDRILAISAASILAKVARDRIMGVLAEKYKGYGFEQHKGYPTAQHRTQIAALGPCRVHRRTFGGVREFIAAK